MVAAAEAKAKVEAKAAAPKEAKAAAAAEARATKKAEAIQRAREAHKAKKDRNTATAAEEACTMPSASSVTTPSFLLVEAEAQAAAEARLKERRARKEAATEAKAKAEAKAEAKAAAAKEAAAAKAKAEPGAVQLCVKDTRTKPVWVQPGDTVEAIKIKYRAQCVGAPVNNYFRFSDSGGHRLGSTWTVPKTLARAFTLTLLWGLGGGGAPGSGTLAAGPSGRSPARGTGAGQARCNLYDAMNATDAQGEALEADVGPPPLMGKLARAVGYRGCDAGAGAAGDAVPELAPKPLLVTEAAQRLTGEVADAAGYVAQAEAYEAWWGRRQARLDEQTAVAAEEAAKEAEEKTKAEAAGKLAAEHAEQLEGYVSPLEACTVAAAFGKHKNIERPWQASYPNPNP